MVKNISRPVISNNYQSVFNKRNALVGQTLSDGLELGFTVASTKALLKQIEVCFYLSLTISEDPSFPEYDFGYFSDAYRVIPLGLEVTLAFPDSSAAVLCGNVHLSDFAVPRLVPIKRILDWTTPGSDLLNSGETICLYIVASLFAVLTTAVFLVCSFLAFEKTFSLSKPKNYLWLTFFCQCIIRAIYFYLIASGVLGNPERDQLVDFWMIELPIILYLISNMLIALSFFFLRRLQNTHGESSGRVQFLFTSMLCTFFLVMVFISFLLAFNYLVVAPAEISGSLFCPTLKDTSSTARTIRIVYVSLILFIAGIIAAIELFMGLSVYNGIREVYGARRILHLSLTSSIGILSDSLAFLIYYIVNSPTPYFSIVLIFTEVLPISVLVYILSYQRMKTRLTARESQNGNKWAPTGESHTTPSVRSSETSR